MKNVYGLLISFLLFLTGILTSSAELGNSVRSISTSHLFLSEPDGGSSTVKLNASITPVSSYTLTFPPDVCANGSVMGFGVNGQLSCASTAAGGVTTIANGGTGLSATGAVNELFGTNASGNAFEHKSVVATSQGSVVASGYVQSNSSIVAVSTIKTLASLILEDPSAGVSTVTVQASTVPTSSYTLTLPPAACANGSVLGFGENGQLTCASASSGSSSVDTEWAAYTPTMAGFGTVTDTVGYWRRVGDSMDLQIGFATGTVAASTAKISLPGSYALNASKINNSSHYRAIGSWYCQRSTANSVKTGTIHVSSADASNLRFGTTAYPISGNPLTALDGNAACDNTTYVWVSVSGIPISGWGVTGTTNGLTDYAFYGTFSGTFSTTSTSYAVPTTSTSAVLNSVLNENMGSVVVYNPGTATIGITFTPPSLGVYAVTYTGYGNCSANEQYAQWALTTSLGGTYLDEQFIHCLQGTTNRLQQTVQLTGVFKVTSLSSMSVYPLFKIYNTGTMTISGSGIVSYNENKIRIWKIN